MEGDLVVFTPGGVSVLDFVEISFCFFGRLNTTLGAENRSIRWRISRRRSLWGSRGRRVAFGGRKAKIDLQDKDFAYTSGLTFWGVDG